MESGLHSSYSEPVPKSSQKVPMPDIPIIKQAIETLHSVLPASSSAFLCGGTVRDLLGGGIPHDFDIVLRSTDFEHVKTGFISKLRDLQKEKQWRIVVRSHRTITLSSGAVEGSQLYMVKLGGDSDTIGKDGKPKTIDLEIDFREMKFYSTYGEPMSMKQLLEADIKTRDFTVNSMYCDTKDMLLIDFKGGNYR